jgi:hypothetical protein
VNEKKRLTLSDPRVLTGISVFLLLLGEMVTDPLAGFVALVLGALLSAFAYMRGSKRLRSFVLALLIVIVVLGISKFPEAAYHLGAYKSHRVSSQPR